MRIGIDIRELEKGKTTGIGRFLRNFVEHARDSRPGHAFFLYGNQRTEPPGESGNLRVRIEPERNTLWWDQVVLPGLAEKDRIDLFFSPYVKGPVRVVCPLVVTIHDLLFLVFPEYSSGRQRIRNALFRWMARQVGQRADLILTDSEHSARDVRRLLGLEEEKIQVLPIGVEERFRPVEDPKALGPVLAKYRIEPPYLFYLGNFKPHKNVQALLEAFARLDRDLRERFHLVLGGGPDPWTRQRERLAEELGIRDRTAFIGRVAEEDLPSLYSGAELFVFPSLYEGFGLPPLEAMACGTAVVSSDRTSLPEVVGEAGLLVDPEDVEALSRAMAQVLLDGELRERLRRKGRERAGRFRADLLCERQMQLLEETAEKGWRRKGSS